jgi:hypothetical protein
MTTSSGREGFCTRCRHANNEHTREREAKCKKCKKGFEICQVGDHGDDNSAGWRLCFIPCGCGKKYYPDKAKSAVPLQPHEYAVDHPGYRPLLYPDEDETSVIDSQTEATDSMYNVSTPLKGESSSTIQNYHGHTRTDSGSSLDQLSWSPATYNRHTIDAVVAGLTEDFSTAHIEGSVPVTGVGDWSVWSWSEEYGCEYRCRTDPTKENGYDYEYRNKATPAASSKPSKHQGSRKGKGKAK